jgi:hypothetical protein
MQPTPLDGLRTLAVNVMINIFPNSDVGPLLAPTVGKQPNPTHNCLLQCHKLENSSKVIFKSYFSPGRKIVGRFTVNEYRMHMFCDSVMCTVRSFHAFGQCLISIAIKKV